MTRKIKGDDTLSSSSQKTLKETMGKIKELLDLDFAVGRTMTTDVNNPKRRKIKRGIAGKRMLKEVREYGLELEEKLISRWVFFIHSRFGLG